MEGEGKDVTLPTLDIDDFIGKSFTTGPDGKLYQLPDQQFANLYWFRYDWFSNPEIKAKFKEKYGYDLGVPVNWSAYEDIAEFFTNDVKEVDGKAIYGHMDYGKKAPDLGWRFTDAWLGMAGVGDKGLPERQASGRVGHPHRGLQPGWLQREPRRRGQGPAAKYALDKYMEWLARPRLAGRPRHGLLPVAAEPRQRQRCPADLLVHGVHRLDGGPADAGKNTVERRWQAALADGAFAARSILAGGHEARLPGRRLLDPTQLDPLDRRKAAWLYAQFTVARRPR